MQIWTPIEQPHDNGEFTVRLNTAGARPFAIIRLSEDGETALTMDNPGDCDRLIKAVVRAKDLLLGAPETPERCGQTRPLGDEPCALPPGHGGWHMDARGNEWPKFAEDPDLDAILNGPGHQAPAGTDAS